MSIKLHNWFIQISIHQYSIFSVFCQSRKGEKIGGKTFFYYKWIKPTAKGRFFITISPRESFLSLVLFLFKGLCGRNSQGVAPFVFCVPRVAFYPKNFHLVASTKVQELLPQIRIKRRLFIGLFPAVHFPFGSPAYCEGQL